MKEKKSVLNKVLDGIEKVGNKLPDPVTLFVLLSVFVIVISAVCSGLGLTAVNPATGDTLEVFNLFSRGGVQYLWTNVISNYAGFAPLTMVLVAIVGSAVAEKSGFLVTVMKNFLGGAKGYVVTAVVIFFGINLNVAGDAGFIILPPLAAMLYMSIKRSPLLGLYVAYASVAAGFCANTMLGLVDGLLYGFTEMAAQMVDETYVSSMAINWYFLIASCIILTIVGTILVEGFLIKRFAVTEEELASYEFEEENSEVTPLQKKGLKFAGLGLLVYLIIFVCMSIPMFGQPALLAGDEASITASAAPFTKGIVFSVTIALFIPGLIYGFVTGRYKSDKDLWADITEGFCEMGGYVFMCFFISIFTSFFAASNLGIILAIKGADFLQAIGFSGIPLMLGLLFLSSVVNLFIGSASAKWAILAPVFIPMMMLLGYDPAVTQLIYRIGDSITNPLSPLFTYMPVILGYALKYDKKAGMGTVIANMIPFSVVFTVVWIIQLIVWVVFNLPLGPGGGIYL